MLYFLTKKYRYHAVFKTSAYLLLFKTRTFNCSGEKAIRISVIRGFDILFNSVEGHYVVHKEPGL